MLFTFSSGSLPTYTLSAIFDVGRHAGADGVELLLSHRLVAQGAARVRVLEDGFRMPVTSVHSVLRLRETTLEQQISDILESARFARDLPSCRTLVVHLPDLSEQSARSRWLDAVARAADVLAGSKTSVSVETPGVLNDESPDPRLSGPEWLMMLCGEWNLKTTLDTSHVASLGWNMLDDAVRLLPTTDNIHLSDSGTRHFRYGLLNSLVRDHQPPGDGILPLDRFLRRLREKKYDGLITLEISPFRVPWYWPPATERALRDMLRYCRLCVGGVAMRVSQGSRKPRKRSTRIDG
jgi:sugar phosphate isomerase/epimerase